MGLLDSIINGVLGGFGIVRRTKPFTCTNTETFKLALRRAMDMAMAENKAYLLVGCVGMRTPDFISGGIQGAEDGGGSFFSHVFTGVGETMGNNLRLKYPFLMKNSKVPVQAKPWEIVESEPEGVVCDSLEKYLNDRFQMHLFGRAFELPEAEAILLRAYATVGDAYDYGEIAKHVFGFLPDSDHLKVCSSSASSYFEIIERLAKPSVRQGFETPKDVNAYLYPNQKWDFYPFNIPGLVNMVRKDPA